MDLTAAFCTKSVACVFRISTTNNNTCAAPSSAATIGIVCIRLFLRANTVSGEVVSNTDTRSFISPMVNSFESIRKSAASEKADTSDLAANILAAYAGIETPRSAASFSATSRSWSVVVGLRNSNVSDRMHESATPFMSFGIWAAAAVPIRSSMIVAVQASGRTVMSIGALVSSPPTSL